MTKLQNSINLQATPAAVWRVLGDLARAPEYIPGIVKAQIDGTQRTCTTADGSEIREMISNYSAEQRTYSFQHLQTPLPVRSSQGSFTVAVDDNGETSVSMLWEFEPLDANLTESLTTMLDQAAKLTLDELKRAVG